MGYCSLGSPSKKLQSVDEAADGLPYPEASLSCCRRIKGQRTVGIGSAGTYSCKPKLSIAFRTVVPELFSILFVTKSASLDIHINILSARLN